jgi:hypothetical protein
MKVATPKKKSDEGNSSDLPESVRFDLVNLQKQRFGEESEGSEGKQRQTESWHFFSTF